MFCHIDADSFFASVIERTSPKLRGKPIIAVGMGGGCVIAASYAAKKYGVKTAMRVSDAKRLLPKDYIAAPVDFAEAHAASQQIESIVNEHCATIESTSVDEWYLDLKGVPGGVPSNLDTWAHRVQADVQARTALAVSIGIAPTKLLAKMASPYRKPNGIVIVTNNVQRSNVPAIFSLVDFLKNNPAADIPGIGWRRSVRVESLGLTTAWDIAEADAETIRKLFGRPGNEMQSELKGTPVHHVETAYTAPKSVSRCRSFPPVKDQAFITSQIMTHLAYMVFKMRREELGCNFLGVWLRDGDYRHHHRDVKLSQMATTEEELVPYVNMLLRRLFNDVTAVTQAGLVLSGLHTTQAVQYSLFDNTERVDRGEGLQKTLDRLRTQFGRDVIRRGAAVLAPKLHKRLLTREGR